MENVKNVDNTVSKDGGKVDNMIEIVDKQDDGILRWAVVGFNRDNFSEEFISTHPMDFYEDGEHIKGEYDIYLMNEHGYYTPSVEFRDGQHTVFESSLTFFGLAPNYTDEDFRLKHLRMLMGTEDYFYRHSHACR